MNIFLSYASEQKSQAEAVSKELRGMGHQVFLDRDNLAPGLTFDGRIREAVLAADYFIFLVSEAALTRGRYTLTELSLARRKWPHPKNNVLPVMVEPIPVSNLPGYLQGVTFLQPMGDLVSEVAFAVSTAQKNSSGRRMKRRILAALLAVTTLIISGLVIAKIIAEMRPPARSEQDALDIQVLGDVNSMARWGDTLSFQLQEKVLGSMDNAICEVNRRKSPNIESVTHDKKCSSVTVQMKQGPFLGKNGKALTTTYTRHFEDPLEILVSDRWGRVLWSTTLYIQSTNLSQKGLTFPQLPEAGSGYMQGSYILRDGEAVESDVYLGEKPLSTRFTCSITRQSHMLRADLLSDDNGKVRIRLVPGLPANLKRATFPVKTPIIIRVQLPGSDWMMEGEFNIYIRSDHLAAQQ